MTPSLRAALMAGGLVGLAETCELLVRGATPRTAGGVLGTASICIGFALAGAAIVATSGALLGWWLAAERLWAAGLRDLRDSFAAPVGRQVAAGATDPSTLPARRVFVPALVGITYAASVYAVVRMTERFEERTLAAGLVAVLLLLLGAGVLLLAPALDRALARLLVPVARIPRIGAVARRGVPAALALGVALAAIAGRVAWGWRATLTEVSWRALCYALLVTAVWIVSYSFWLRRAAASEARPVSSPLWTVGVLAATAAAGLGVAAFTLQVSSASRAVLARTALADPASSYLRGIADFDEDGHASVFGGRDCAPFDAFIHPGARDLPGNGVDEDCTGSDYVLRDRSADPALVPLPPGFRPIPNLLLITVDTLRFDHMGLAGYERDTTPEIDRLAARGAHFPIAYTSAPRTVRAVPSMLTGRYASTIAWGATRGNWDDITPATPTLAEFLAPAGFQCTLFVLQRYFDEPAGLYRSLSRVGAAKLAPYYLRDESKPSGQHITDGVIEYLEAATTRRTFVWAHYYDPHIRFHTGRFGKTKIDLYDESVRYTDEQIGRLLEYMSTSGRSASTLIVFTADHGQGLGDHGKFGHGSNLYEGSMRAPLVITGPGIPPYVHADVVGETVDIVPTVLELLGVKVDPDSDGHSLAARVVLGANAPTPGDPERTAFLEALPDAKTDYDIRALVRWPHKLVRNMATGGDELYDLEADPGERRDILGEDPTLDAALSDALASRIARGDWARALGPKGYVRLEPPEPAIPVTVDIAGTMRVLGVEAPALRGGAAADLTLYLTAIRPIPRAWKVRTSLIGPPGCRVTADHAPAARLHAMNRWQRGEYIVDRFKLRIPKGCRNETVVLYVGLAGKDAPKHKSAPPATAPAGATDSSAAPAPAPGPPVDGVAITELVVH